MSLTQGSINLQSLIQSIISLPIYLDPATLQVRPNHQSIRYRLPNGKPKICLGALIFSFVYITDVMFTLFCLWRLCYLYVNWETVNDPEQVSVYIFLLSGYAISVSVYPTYANNVEGICYIINQRFKLLKVISLGFPSLKRLPKLGEVYIYGFALCLLFVPVASALGPFVVRYSMLQIVYLQLFKIFGYTPSLVLTITLKISESLVYGSLCFHYYGVVMSNFIVIFVFLEAIQKLSSRLFEQLSFYNDANFGLLRKGKLDSQRWQRRFSKAFKLFRSLEILMRSANMIFADFIVVSAGIGVVLATVGGFTLLKLYNDLPLIIYSCISLMLPVVLGINFILHILTAIPHDNGEMFKVYWKTSLKLNRMERLQLRACGSLKYYYGPVEEARRQTALTITDFIANSIATFALMEGGL